MGIFTKSGFRASGGLLYEDVIISTTEGVSGREINSLLGFVFAVGAGISIGNQAIIEKSYKVAIDELVKNCKDMGGNAVVGCRISNADGLIHIYGTAVQLTKLSKNTPRHS